MGKNKKLIKKIKDIEAYCGNNDCKDSSGKTLSSLPYPFSGNSNSWEKEYNDLKEEEISYSPPDVKPFMAFLAEELDFLEEEDIVASELTTKWEWITEDLAEKYFLFVLIPFYIVNPKLTNAELVKLGFKPFIQKLKRTEDINFSKIKNFYIHRKKENLIKLYARLYGKKKLDKKLTNAESRLNEIGGAVSHATLIRNKIKLNIFFDLGFVPVKCKECNVDIVFFNALQLHHLTEKKTITLQDLYEKLYTYEEGLRRFKAEGVEILCANHHNKKIDFYSTTFANLIFKRDLFSLSAEDIDAYISSYLKEFSKTDEYKRVIFKKYTLKKKPIPKKILIKWKESIKAWIRKRYVFSELFDGKCTICGSSDLSSLELHHINPKLKKIIKKWQNIRNLDCEEIIRLIKEEKCISLCSNCHSFLTSKYYVSVKEILKGFYSKPEIDAIAKKVQVFYKKAVRTISNFKYDLKKTEYKSPLKLKFSQKNIWKIHLMAIYFYLKIFGRKSFFNRDFLFETSFNKKVSFNLFRKTKFLNGKTSSSHALIFFFTKEGEKKVKSLIKQHPKVAIKIENFMIRRLNEENINYIDLYKQLKIFPIIRKGCNNQEL